MRRRGYRLTRYADDWVVTCRSLAEAQAALASATRILKELGVTLHAEKTRIVHIHEGFEFLGYKIKRGSRPLKLVPGKIRSGARQGHFYAYPREKSIQHFKEQIRQLTRRKTPLSTPALTAEINPIIRGWGNYFCKAHVRKLFNRLDRWIVCRLWSHRYKRWRYCGLETASRSQAIRRVQTGEFSSTDTFISTAPRAHLCESPMRENCMPSLSGGRRLALGRLLRPDTV